MMRPVTKAIFPVAGLGTRFLPATKSIPKEILTLVDRPLIQYAIDEARSAGIEEFIFINSRGKSALEDYFDHNVYLESELERKGKDALLEILNETNMGSGEVAYLRQHRPLGLGHAIWCARNLIGNEAFAVILPDDVIATERKSCLQQMIEAHAQTGGNMVAMMEVAPSEVSSYGILEVSQDIGNTSKIDKMVEKPAIEDAPSNLAAIGRYILTPETLSTLSYIDTGSGGEIQLTDALAVQAKLGNVFGYRFEGERFDCGSKSGFLRATLAFALARPDLKADLESYIGEMFSFRHAAE